MTDDRIGILVVQLDDRRIGLPVAVVRFMTRAAAIAPLPKAPRVVEGVLNIRGSLVPVVDLRSRFGLRAVPLDPDQHFVVADAGTRQVALRVDQVLYVMDCTADQIEPTWNVVPHAEHVAGIARLPDGVLVIYDLERLLSLEEENALEAALDLAISPAETRPQQ